MTVNPIISSLLDSGSSRRTTIVAAAQENSAEANIKSEEKAAVVDGTDSKLNIY
ncbi:hypothetical protein BS47DRAFT_1350865 [Hydnum rufescens UP504]|uniref:Uncharacterized protein n=1 Tax=Hydnum rufescens UP504 TaxID=1448309 RepID=A0A9P6ALK1_9AGAM|nr:hypothetical protein BS47DRAFT_1350865 [Hydnum rufescens UP504]